MRDGVARRILVDREKGGAVMAMSSIGQPVVIDASNMKRFAEVASKPKPMVKAERQLKFVRHPGGPKKDTK